MPPACTPARSARPPARSHWCSGRPKAYQPPCACGTALTNGSEARASEGAYVAEQLQCSSTEGAAATAGEARHGCALQCSRTTDGSFQGRGATCRHSQGPSSKPAVHTRRLAVQASYAFHIKCTPTKIDTRVLIEGHAERYIERPPTELVRQRARTRHSRFIIFVPRSHAGQVQALVCPLSSLGGLVIIL